MKFSQSFCGLFKWCEIPYSHSHKIRLWQEISNSLKYMGVGRPSKGRISNRFIISKLFYDLTIIWTIHKLFFRLFLRVVWLFLDALVSKFVLAQLKCAEPKIQNFLIGAKLHCILYKKNSAYKISNCINKVAIKWTRLHNFWFYRSLIQLRVILIDSRLTPEGIFSLVIPLIPSK